MLVDKVPWQWVQCMGVQRRKHCEEGRPIPVAMRVAVRDLSENAYFVLSL